MVVHLATNASLANGTETFQRAVFNIHALGKLLPVVEWSLIFAPLLFHGLLGVWIALNGRSNTSHYRFANNHRYTWQRWTGLIALVYLMTHVFHLHGWFHFELWLDVVARPLGMANFKPYNAASTLARAMDGWFWPAFYLIGVWACVYHLANGLWTAGITWGLWISASAQARATKVCTAIGVVLLVVGTVAWYASLSTDPEVAERIENRMYSEAVKAGFVPLSEEKRTQPDVTMQELMPVIEGAESPEADESSKPVATNDDPPADATSSAETEPPVGEASAAGDA